MIGAVISAVENIIIYGLGTEGWLVNLVLFSVLFFIAVRNLRSELLHQVVTILLLLTMVAGIILHLDDWKISS